MTQHISLRYLACGDLHITNDRPRYRTDDYLETCINKFTWHVSKANELDARLIIAGDLLDSNRVPVYVINLLIEILMDCCYTPYVIAGQHDMRYHQKNLQRTLIYNMHLSGTIKLLQDYGEGGVTGVGFGSEIPEEGNDILLIHKCVTPSDPPFFLPDAVKAADLARMHPQFKVIVSGDYHVPFVYNDDDLGTIVVNCGTMMRNKKDMQEHKPVANLIAIEDRSVKVTQIPVPVQPPEEVFNLDQIEYDAKHGITIDTSKLRELMQSTTEEHIKLDDIVYALGEENGVLENPIAQQIIEDVFENVEYNN